MESEYSKSSLSLSYNFAHRVLPVLALWDSKKFYKDTFHERGDRYITQLWNELAQKLNTLDSWKCSPVVVSKLRNGMELCLITTPTPKEVLEVYYVAITVLVEKRLFGKNISECRYFTLELGYDEESKRNEYHVCEWVSPFPNPKRRNHGTIPSASKSLFIGVIEAVLAGEISSSEDIADTRSAKFCGNPNCGTLRSRPNGKYEWIVQPGYSPIHPLAHIALRNLYDIQSEVLPHLQQQHAERLRIIEQWADVHNGYWSEEQEERFVRQFEIYAGQESSALEINYKNESLSPVLQNIFDILMPIKNKNE